MPQKNSLTILILLVSGICSGQGKPYSKSIETNCDSIYKGKGYKIILQHFPNGTDTTTDYNTTFQLSRVYDSKQKIIYQDTIYSQTDIIEFRDFNNDSTKDILIQNISDVRSNWSYYLYLVDTTTDRMIKINGFEKIKNPNYLTQYNLIDSYVNSGRDWTSFYKIKGDSIRDYEIIIYDDHTESGIYESEYEKAIRSILKNEK